jgi:hypothetical protein
VNNANVAAWNENSKSFSQQPYGVLNMEYVEEHGVPDAAIVKAASRRNEVTHFSTDVHDPSLDDTPLCRGNHLRIYVEREHSPAD